MDPITSIITMSDAVAKLASLKDKLRANPSAAAAALADALGEVDKTYFAIESEFARLVALAVNPGALERDITPLAELEGGKLRTRVHASRGHCSKIANIYERDLKRWFEKVLNRTDVLITEEIFDTLRNEDELLYALLEPLAQIVSDEARAAMDILTAPPPDFPAVKLRLLQARSHLQPIRDRMNAIANQLGSLQQEFIEVSGAV
jgi:phosphate uptake regulator